MASNERGALLDASAPTRSPAPTPARGNGVIITSARTRSGCEAANSAASAQPSVIAISAGCSAPTASSDRAHVVDLLLERRHTRRPVRHPGSPPVEHDQPRERRDPRSRRAKSGSSHMASMLQMNERHEHDVQAAPRRAPDRRSADHRCARTASPERPPGHTTPGPAVSERTSGPRVEPSPSGGPLSGYGRFRCSGTWNGLDPASSSTFRQARSESATRCAARSHAARGRRHGLRRAGGCR